MSNSEISFKNNLIKDGYIVTKRGYPDFFVYKVIDDFVVFGFFEIKQDPDIITSYQKMMITMMNFFGLPVRVVRNGEKIRESDFKKIHITDFQLLHRKIFKHQSSKLPRKQITVERIKIEIPKID